MALGRMDFFKAVAAVNCSPTGEALLRQSLKSQIQKPVAVKLQMMMPENGHKKKKTQYKPTQQTQFVVQHINVWGSKEAEFILSRSVQFLFIVENFMHKGKNCIPKKKAIGLITFWFCLSMLHRKQSMQMVTQSLLEQGIGSVLSAARCKGLRWAATSLSYCRPHS